MVMGLSLAVSLTLVGVAPNQSSAHLTSFLPFSLVLL